MSMELMIAGMGRLAPYEKRVIELLRNSKDKRARKLAKKRVLPLSPPFFFFIDGVDADCAWWTAWNFRACEKKGRRTPEGHCGVEESRALI